MRYLLPFLSLAFLISACGSAPARSAPENITPELVSDTVAIYPLLSTRPTCTGVWVGQYRILTAGHCVADLDENPNFYTVATDPVFPFEAPERLHSMQLIKADTVHDLALYRTGAFDTPHHHIAALAKEEPVPGDTILFMGHTRGLTWSFKHGWVSSYRGKYFKPAFEDLQYLGPWMQVSAPIAPGDSGGGAYNVFGELVGICSNGNGNIPNNANYVTVETIRDFLK